jgi:PAS domain-containing protein
MDLEGASKVLAEVTTALIALVGGVWAVVKYRRARADEAERRTDEYRANEESKNTQLEALNTRLDEILPAIKAVQYEVTANGGGSLRDTVMDIRNEHAIERVARRLVNNVASYEMLLRSGREAEVTFVSPAYVRLTGLTREETADGGWIRAVASEDRDRVSAAAATSMRHGIVLSTTYTVQNVLTGERALVEHMGTPVFNYAGVMVGWVAILQIHSFPEVRSNV